MKWFIPSWNGDLRLVPDDQDPDKTILSIVDPTPEEMRLLEKLGAIFLAQGFVETWDASQQQLLARLGNGHKVRINAPLAKVGPLVVAEMRPGPAVLTAITFKNGEVLTTSGDPDELATLAEALQSDEAKAAAREARQAHEAAEKAEAQAKIAKAEAETKAAKERADKAEAEAKAAKERADKAEKDAAAAKALATVRRPTPSCPSCEPGAIQPASEVLLSFLNDEEHETWARGRFLIVEGGLSGSRYLLAHRHSRLAQKIGRICYDLDAKFVVHFHDRRVPPEEEILAAKLILEHREPWLRNQATMLGAWYGGRNALVFDNPFGDGGDGVPDSNWTAAFGASLMKEIGRELMREGMRALVD